MFHLAQRKDYMMVETRPWALGCVVLFVWLGWVVVVVLVIFSTIRLSFPPFNDDLGTMPTRRPYSWKKILCHGLAAQKKSKQVPRRTQQSLLQTRQKNTSLKLCARFILMHGEANQSWEQRTLPCTFRMLMSQSSKWLEEQEEEEAERKM